MMELVALWEQEETCFDILHLGMKQQSSPSVEPGKHQCHALGLTGLSKLPIPGYLVRAMESRLRHFL